MAKKKMLFIYNPKAGKGQIRTHLSDVIDILVKGGNEVTVYPTQYAGDAVRAAQEKAKRYDCVVASGGDGTLDEVVTGILRSGKIVPVGYIPAGSTNDFANSLGLPKNMDYDDQILMKIYDEIISIAGNGQIMQGICECRSAKEFYSYMIKNNAFFE